MAPALIKIARDRGDPFAAREQVFRTRHPEVTQAVDEALMPRRASSAWISPQHHVGLGVEKRADQALVLVQNGPTMPAKRAGAVLPLSRTRRMRLTAADGLTAKRCAA